jgi:hypothetical protein
MRGPIWRSLGAGLIVLLLSGPALAGSAESPNFRVSAPTDQIAQQVAQFAEKYRRQKALEWLGKEMPTWGQKCPIKVTLTPGGRGTSGGGATTFAFDNGAILEQHMHIEGDLEQILHSVLPHEVTHTVFAYHFRDRVPRWADEGGSVLSENDFERSRHDDLVRRSLAGGKAFRLRYLFDLENYPRDGQDVMTLYAQGYAITRYLVERNGKPAFLNFLADAKRYGWDQALRMHYRLESVEQLEQGWLDWMKRGMRSYETAAAEAPAPPPAPTAGRAHSLAASPPRDAAAAPGQMTGQAVELGRPQAGARRPEVVSGRPMRGGESVPGPGQQGWSPLGAPDQTGRSRATLHPPKLDD